MECLSIPVGVLLMREMPRGGENKRVKRFPAGIWTVKIIIVLLNTITNCTQRYVASRPEPS